MDMSAFGQPGDYDPVTATLSGTGVNTATFNGSGYNTTSSFSVVTDVGIPGVSPFSVTQPTFQNNPVGPDPGLALTTPGSTATGNSSPPFYGLFPPPSGTGYSGTVANPSQHPFSYTIPGNSSSSAFFVSFAGSTELILGDTPVQSGNSFSYADSELILTADITQPDPTEPVNFFGTVVITAVPEPDSLPVLAGVLALLAVCARGARQKARAA